MPDFKCIHHGVCNEYGWTAVSMGITVSETPF
jgi:hypothetical protein